VAHGLSALQTCTADGCTRVDAHGGRFDLELLGGSVPHAPTIPHEIMSFMMLVT